MTDLRRWLETEDVSPEVRELLRSARPARPLDPETRARSKRRISRALAVPAAAGAFFWLQHAALGAVLGAAFTGAMVAVTVLPSDAPSPKPLGTVTTVDRPAPTAATASRPEYPVEAELAEPAPIVEKRSATPRPDIRENALEREARLLERARSLLSSDPQAALAMLTRHEKEFARGSLQIERELLAVDALLRLRQTSEAEARGRALRGRTPGSLYERRLDELLNGARR